MCTWSKKSRTLHQLVCTLAHQAQWRASVLPSAPSAATASLSPSLLWGPIYLCLCCAPSIPPVPSCRPQAWGHEAAELILPQLKVELVEDQLRWTARSSPVLGERVCAEQEEELESAQSVAGTDQAQLQVGERSLPSPGSKNQEEERDDTKQEHHCRE